MEAFERPRSARVLGSIQGWRRARGWAIWRASGCLDVAMAPTPDIAGWMPSLMFGIPHPARDVYRSGGAVRVFLGWDQVERAFPGQFVEASSLDGEYFPGRVTAVDIPGCYVWAQVE